MNETSCAEHGEWREISCRECEAVQRIAEIKEELEQLRDKIRKFREVDLE